MKLYGSSGCGSAVVEVVLQPAGQSYEFIQTSFRDKDEHFEALKKANLQAQVWEKNFGK